jgi:hypothetical protein
MIKKRHGHVDANFNNKEQAAKHLILAAFNFS